MNTKCTDGAMEGNTNSIANNKKSRVNPSKKWVFTLNNYTDVQMVLLKQRLETLGEKYIVGKEVGECGTPHLQGWVQFKNRVRPITAIGIKEIHWEKQKGSNQQCIDYCQKEGNVWIVKDCGDVKRRIKDPLEGKELYPWQQFVLDLIKQEPNDRDIYWFWEPDGNIGKTSFVKHVLIHNNDCTVVDGKVADAIHGVTEMVRRGKDPRVVFMDIVRTQEGRISYSAIEKIKNGMFFNTKYETGMVLYDCPHVIIFANWEPDTYALSKDRWQIYRIDNEGGYSKEDIMSIEDIVNNDTFNNDAL